MNNQALYFELLSIMLMLALGVTLLSMNLPGWGLIAVAGVLATLSGGLRAVPARATANHTPAP